MTDSPALTDSPAAQAVVEDQELTPEEAEAAYEQEVWTHLRRNYLANLSHGLLGQTGFRLVNTPTFLPTYLFQLSGSDFIVGLGLALQQVGGILSPVIGATQIEHRKRVLPAGFIFGSLMRLQVLGIALAGWLLSDDWLLVAILTFLFLLGLFSGIQRVIFFFLMSKVIPLSRRGILVGIRNFLGGLVAASVAYLGGYFVEANFWGNGYSTTFLVAFVFTSLGLASLTFVREPEPPTTRRQSSLRERFGDLPALLKSDRGFFYYFFARAFAVMGRMAMPFYILYASTTIELTGTNIGLLSLIFLLSETTANVLWGLLADKSGFRLVFLLANSAWVCATLLMLSTTNELAIFMAFGGLGAGLGGFMMSSQNIILEFGKRDDLPMRIALSNTAESVAAAGGPLLGGLIAMTYSYPAVFWTAIVFQIAAILMVLFLVDEPRRRPHPTPPSAQS